MNRASLKKGKIKLSKLRECSGANKTKKPRGPDPREKISSYFQSTQTQSNNESPELFESNSTQHSKRLNISDDDSDFATPKVLRQPKVFEVKPQKNPKKVTKSKKIHSTFGSTLTMIPSCSDTNQEHLELAVAMSESLDEFENPNRKKFEGTSKGILDQFGFKSNRSLSNVAGLISKRNQNGRKKFRFLTPILFLRTDQDRAKRIEKKVSDIFANIAIYNEANVEFNSPKNLEYENNKPRSFLLRDYYNENSIIFKKNGLGLEEMTTNIFYNKLVEQSDVKVGTLLKDWHSIPGREKTPPLRDKTPPLRDTSPEPTSSDDATQCFAIENNCVSPELFSDDELEDLSDKVMSLTSSKSNNIFLDKVENLPAKANSLSNNSIYSEESCLLKSNSGNKNTSDRSETESVSLLDNISPKRKKKILQRSLEKKTCSKNIFEQTTLNNAQRQVSLFNITSTQKRLNSPGGNNKIDKGIRHFESYIDDSNDGFGVIQSSNGSNDVPNNDVQSKENFSDDFHLILSSNESNSVDQVHDDVNQQSNKLSNNSLQSKESDDFCLIVSSSDSNNADLNLAEVKDRLNSEELVDLTQISNNSGKASKEQEMRLEDECSLSSVTTNVDQNLAEVKDVLNSIVETLKTQEPEELLDLTQTSNNSDDSLKGKEMSSTPNNRNIIDQNQTEVKDLLNSSLETLKRQEPEELLDLTQTSNNSDKAPKEQDISSEDEYSPEFDYFNSTNNKKFYDSFNKTSTSSNGSTVNEKEHSLKKKNVQPVAEDCCYNRVFDDDFDIFPLFEHANKTKQLEKESGQNQSTPKAKSSTTSLSNRSDIINRHFEDLLRTSNNSDISVPNNSIFQERLMSTPKASTSLIKKNSFSDSTLKEILDEFRNDDVLYLSQSIDLCSDVSDEELNYSSFTPYKKNLKNRKDSPKTPLNSKCLKNPDILKLSTPLTNKDCPSPNCYVQLDNSLNEILLQNDARLTRASKKGSFSNTQTTPKNKFLIKTCDVTPRGNFSDMETPERNKELEKFGMKPMKRARGVKMLRYIYDATHPVSQNRIEIIENISSSDEENKVAKRRKINVEREYLKPNNENKIYQSNEAISIIGDQIAQSEILHEMIFERKQSSKIASCRLPLHIAWYNFLASQQELQKKILLYEPLQIEEIYSDFKLIGHKFLLEDLIKFLDKHCITIKLDGNKWKKKRNAPKIK